MPLLYTSEAFSEHRTGRHPEQPARIGRILAMLAESPHMTRWERACWEPATLEQVARNHSKPYIEKLREYAAAGGGRIEADTVLSPRSYEIALLAAGAACTAVERVIAGTDSTALCLLRPPGHHALPTAAMGFCLLNNVAVAARAAIEQHGLNRVMIVDFDVHHGNGTQDSFYSDEQVAFLSIHRSPFYPGTGGADETGTGKGLGTTLNVPLPLGTSREEYHTRFEKALEQLAAKVRPELILVSAGFDAHRLDPVGSLGLEEPDFARLTTAVKQVAQQYAGGKLVSLLEGGYNLNVLPACVEQHLRVLGEA